MHFFLNLNHWAIVTVRSVLLPTAASEPPAFGGAPDADNARGRAIPRRGDVKRARQVKRSLSTFLARRNRAVGRWLGKAAQK